ncbi:MAG: Crp/Fnr family transcriptional regulator [Bacteroidia bacterium]|nr:Crp/Fnr family transcriptional regulator [Bacteroidia bacterium]
MLLPFHQKDFTEEIEASTIVKSLKAGEQIVGMNKFIQVIPILNSGLLGVYRTDDDGRDMLLYYIKPGESCIMSFLAGINNDTSKVKAIAEEDSELTLVPIDKVTQWVRKYPEWTDYIFKLYHQRFEELLNVVNSIAFQKMDERIWQLLMKKSELSKSKEIQVTHQQLADELGSTREVISRLLKQMEKTGIVALGRNKITLV